MTLSIQSRQKFCVQNRLGLHATPAALIVRLLNKYDHIKVWVRNENEQVNGKSIMGLMMLEARRHTNLLFIIEGGTLAEQKSLLQELKTLFDKKFYEES